MIQQILSLYHDRRLCADGANKTVVPTFVRYFQH
jgi:hypothetical protein